MLRDKLLSLGFSGLQLLGIYITKTNSKYYIWKMHRKSNWDSFALKKFGSTYIGICIPLFYSYSNNFNIQIKEYFFQKCLLYFLKQLNQLHILENVSVFHKALSENCNWFCVHQQFMTLFLSITHFFIKANMEELEYKHFFADRAE